MKKLVINGMVLTQDKKVGVPRYVIELLNSLDEIVPPFDVEVLVPCHAEYQYKHLKKIIVNPERFRKQGKEYSKLWQFIDVPRYILSQDCIVLQPAFGYAPVRNDLVIIYDLQPEHFAQNYTAGGGAYGKIKQALRANAIRRSRKIFAISNYVKQDLTETYHVPAEKITVVPCGWQHFERVQPDAAVFEQFPEVGRAMGEYYFSLGSRYEHKNQRWIYAAAKKHPQSLFVITGYNDVASYSGDLVKEAPDNVLFTGYLSDGQVKALMTHCKAFIQPSLSEGFGIPPMEALSTGAKIIVSNVTSLPEVYGDTAHYIDPLNYTDIDLDRILETAVSDPGEVLERYSWRKAAEILADTVVSLLDDGKRVLH